ncbi:hypothetical protein BU23DRAFT_18439 [Bimuria novae-zelandiae CBS 107.79]|uniref:Uncharacterized protein n=1 Tax=Bimuria novae-zelandiae CBS 107.79 TaxID=1447943 RepID=A0A6A5UP44_9PLEO|nr:hypothetical protein BU23DRAFT_18439 [Bimuria novae-zelandiae CBS 107.79]
MSELKNKGLPESIEVLSLFLASSPSIYHAQGPDIHEPIPYELYLFYERSCNIFIVQAPKPSALYDSIKNELVSLRQHCQLQLPTNICGVSQPWGDMRDVILGDDDLGDVFCPGSESNVCTFIFLVYWGSLDAMERFKNPKQESFQRYGGRIASDWWTKEVVARFLTLHDAGACIKQGTFRMRDFEANAPLTWPHVKNWQEQAMVRRRTRVRERGCTSCCTM